MSLVELVPGKLWEYENFLSTKEINVLIEAATAATEEDWYGLNRHESHWYDGRSLVIHHLPAFYDTTRNIVSRLRELFTGQTTDIEIGTIVRNSELVRAATSNFHKDNFPEENADCKYGILLYLNDDFDGGELCYPDLGVEYKPKPGALIVHYAGNLHGVASVSNGTRYSMASFVLGYDAELVGYTTDTSSVE